MNLMVNNYPLHVIEAPTSEQKSQGLAIKKNSSENQGMLFIYNHEQLLSFWMKNMKFPIDIIG